MKMRPVCNLMVCLIAVVFLTHCMKGKSSKNQEDNGQTKIGAVTDSREVPVMTYADLYKSGQEVFVLTGCYEVKGRLETAEYDLVEKLLEIDRECVVKSVSPINVSLRTYDSGGSLTHSLVVVVEYCGEEKVD